MSYVLVLAKRILGSPNIFFQEKISKFPFVTLPLPQSLYDGTSYPSTKIFEISQVCYNFPFHVMPYLWCSN